MYLTLLNCTHLRVIKMINSCYVYFTRIKTRKIRQVQRSKLGKPKQESQGPISN